MMWVDGSVLGRLEDVVMVAEPWARVRTPVSIPDPIDMAVLLGMVWVPLSLAFGPLFLAVVEHLHGHLVRAAPHRTRTVARAVPARRRRRPAS